MQGHKLILAKRSPWFHKLFQSKENGGGVCHVAFFNFAERIVQTAIDVIYGKEFILTINEKNKLVFLLTKLGISWSEFESEEPKEPTEPQKPKKRREQKELKEPTVIECNIAGGKDASKESQHSTNTNFDHEQIPLAQSSTIKDSKVMQPPTRPSTSSSNVVQEKETHKDTSNEDDFFSILDQFTETSEEELQKINHILIGENGQPDRMYKCMKCVEKYKFFTQAQKHHLEHEFVAFRPVREMLKRAELGRQEDDRNLSKIEKAIGKAEKKKLIRALRFLIMYNIQDAIK